MGTRFSIRILSRSRHAPKGEDQVALSLLAGADWDHLTLCGTLTMTERELADLLSALEQAMGEPVRVLEPGAVA